MSRHRDPIICYASIGTSDLGALVYLLVQELGQEEAVDEEEEAGEGEEEDEPGPNAVQPIPEGSAFFVFSKDNRYCMGYGIGKR